MLHRALIKEKHTMNCKVCNGDKWTVQEEIKKKKTEGKMPLDFPEYAVVQIPLFSLEYIMSKPILTAKIMLPIMNIYMDFCDTCGTAKLIKSEVKLQEADVQVIKKSMDRFGKPI